MTAATWETLSAGYAEAIRAYHRERGQDADSAAVQSTVRTNTELVPKRGDNLVRLLGELTSVHDLRGRRVLELGCGFGALATYLAWRYEPARLVAVDNRADLVETARASTGSPPNLTFERADMRDLDLGADFDVAILNNSFIYLPTAADMDRALRALHGSVATDGWALFYHANKWQWREPFTRDPLVHLLPPAIARPVARVTGWRHNHGRVRLAGPRELSRRVRRAGFVDPRAMALGHFYALAARRR
jgi:SAM-dependent methyltransferase